MQQIKGNSRGALLRDIVDTNTASEVWADTAYRWKDDEKWLRGHGRFSQTLRKKAKVRPMPERNRKANAVNGDTIPYPAIGHIKKGLDRQFHVTASQGCSHDLSNTFYQPCEHLIIRIPSE